MNLRKRLEKLERLAKPAARKVVTRDMTGVAGEELLTAVTGAIDSSDEDLFQQIMSLVDERAKVPWQNEMTKEKHLDADGKEMPAPHFFLIWLWGLEAGSWRLPERLPREVLAGFCGLHGAVLFRCEDCLTAFGNARLYQACPVCQGTRLSYKDLSVPEALWMYTPRDGSATKR